jgi:hypothetical protein
MDSLNTRSKGFIAGVTNQLFEDRTAWWDVLCNIDTGKITVSKDIAPVASSSQSSAHYDDTRVVPMFSNGATSQSSSKHDNSDNEFMADVSRYYCGHCYKRFIFLAYPLTVSYMNHLPT